MTLKNIMLAGVAAAAIGAVTAPAHADNIVTNQWYTGAFNTTGTPLFGPGFTVGVNGPVLPGGTANAVAAPGSPWVITLGNGGYITIVDVEAPGDFFTLNDNGSFLGSTSIPGGGATGCSEDISCALGGAYSQGTFLLGAGTHSITGVFTGHVGYGDFDFIVQAAPEPASMAVLGAGLAGLGVLRRRKKSV